MTEQLMPIDFHASPGVEDWRVLFWGAHAFYRTTSFAQAADFVAGIARAATAVGHEPDVDVRPHGVTVRTFTQSNGALSRKDADLAAAISTAAQRLGLVSDPSVLQVVGIAVAQDADLDTRPFWEAAFGYQRVGDEDLVDPLGAGPHLWFHELTPRQARPRAHPHRRLRAGRRGREAGPRRDRGRWPHRRRPPRARWWTIASPDNHGVDIAGWADTEA